MAQNKKEQEKKSRWNLVSSLQEETVEAVTAILFIIIGVFLLLASFNRGGIAGEKTFEGLWYLFGVGYFLLPILLVTLGVTFLRSLKHSLTTIRIIGSFLFLFSGLGLVSIITETQGGVLGSLIARPLVSFFDTLASILFLLGILTVSILIVFDTPLRLKTPSIFTRLFSKSRPSETDIKIMSDGKEIKAEKNVQNQESQKDDEDDTNREEEQPVKKTKKQEPILEDEQPGIPVPSFYKSFGPYNPPPLSLLERDSGKPGVGDIKANANIIRRTLQNFGINVEMDEVSIGPSVTRYALKPAEGVKLSRIVGLRSDLSLALAAHPIRIEAPIPGKSLVGIEIPNSKKTTVGLGTLLGAKDFNDSDKPLTIGLGKGISGMSHFANLAKAPHMLIAGTTGSGKSVTIHTLITSLLYRNSPETLKFIMIDPKRVELTLYNKIPHLLTPVITDAKKAILALKWAAKEMDRRYDVLEKNAARDIGSYHKNVVAPAFKQNNNSETDLPDPMPYIVIIIDELADIMQTYPKELEAGIVRLAQMSRAVGIHLVLSTQRPSVNVITGLIKANIPSRIALQVASQIDSRTILDQAGAEQLLGAGDMLYLSGEMSKPQRIQSAFISEEEVKSVVTYLAQKYKDAVPHEITLTGDSERNDLLDAMSGGSFGDDEEDDLYEEARQTVVAAGKASTSYLQRKLRVGYARAARLMDILEQRGVIGPGDGAKPREVLLKDESGYGHDPENS